MDNREFAELLLCEATELLGESAGRNGSGDRYREAAIKNNQKEINKLESKQKLSEDEKNKLKELKRANRHLDGWDGTKTEREPGNKAWSRIWLEDDKYHSHMDRAKYMADMSKQIASGNSTKAPEHFPDLAKPFSMPSYSYTFAGVEKYDRSDRKVNPIHKKINDRAKKAQNECADLAVLLTEAALLLNEEVNPKIDASFKKYKEAWNETLKNSEVKAAYDRTKNGPTKEDIEMRKKALIKKIRERLK